MVNYIDSRIRPPRLVRDNGYVLSLNPRFVQPDTSFEGEQGSLKDDIFRLRMELPKEQRTRVNLVEWRNPRQAIELTVRYIAPTPERYEEVVERMYQRALDSSRQGLPNPLEKWRERMYSIHALTLMGASWLVYQGEKSRRR